VPRQKHRTIESRRDAFPFPISEPARTLLTDYKEAEAATGHRMGGAGRREPGGIRHAAASIGVSAGQCPGADRQFLPHLAPQAQGSGKGDIRDPHGRDSCGAPDLPGAPGGWLERHSAGGLLGYNKQRQLRHAVLTYAFPGQGGDPSAYVGASITAVFISQQRR